MFINSQGRRLILGGVDIPHSSGLLGHSDADVLAHAIMDVCWEHWLLVTSDTSSRTMMTPSRADSMKLMAEVCRRISAEGYSVGNIDATVIAQAPKLAPHINAMRENIARVCGVDISQISVKATTEEHLGFTGEKLGMSAHAVALLVKSE